jgi:hypothetical protein
MSVVVLLPESAARFLPILDVCICTWDCPCCTMVIVMMMVQAIGMAMVAGIVTVPARGGSTWTSRLAT